MNETGDAGSATFSQNRAQTSDLQTAGRRCDAQSVFKMEIPDKGKPIMALTFGVHTGQQNCSLEELRRLWRYVDQAGFDWLSVWDHFYEAPPIDGNGSCFETASALTLLAADTAKVTGRLPSVLHQLS